LVFVQSILALNDQKLVRNLSFIFFMQ